MSGVIPVICENPACPNPRITGKRFKCSQCATHYYCSAKCQKAHWKEHKKTCVDYKTQTILDLELQTCYHSKVVGDHLHGKIPYTKNQLNQFKLIHAYIANLPEHPEHIFSCRCKTPLKKAKDFNIIFATNSKADFWSIGATCGKIECGIRKSWNPLISLKKTENLKAYQVFIMSPFFTCKGELLDASCAILNCNCPLIDKDTTFMRKRVQESCVCGLLHFEYVVVQKKGPGKIEIL